MEKSLIKLSNVSKFYYSKGVIASGFTKLSTEFNIGEFVAITGESGSGKSTLLNVISGLDTYEEGEMYINGEETSHYTDLDFENYRRKYISNIFQSFNLINSYTVYQNIELVLLLNGNSKRKIKRKVLELIDTVGLKKFKNTKVSKLSGGQKQRVAIARALINDPDIILADEPTGALDSSTTTQILEILKQIADDGKLVIMVTHSEKVANISSRIVEISDGKIVRDEKKENYQKTISENSLVEESSPALEDKNKKEKHLSLLSSIKLSFKSMWSSKIKNFLMAFGVSISLIAMIIMLSFGSGLTGYISSQAKEYSNPYYSTISKSGKDRDGNPLDENSSMSMMLAPRTFSNDEIVELAGEINEYLESKEDSFKVITDGENKNISYGYGIATMGQGNIVYQTEEMETPKLGGIIYTYSTPPYYSDSKLLSDNGHLPGENEIVLSEAACKFFDVEEPEDVVGKEVTLKVNFKIGENLVTINKDVVVSGVIDVSIFANMLVMYVDYDFLNNCVKEAETLNGYPANGIDPSLLFIKTEDTKTKNLIDKYIKSNRKDLSGSVEEQLEGMFNEMLSTFSIALAIISGISLFVALIMILVVLYMSVSERTKEIGVLKSIGARKKDIRLLFSTESFLIGVLSGITGIVLSLAVGGIFTLVLNLLIGFAPLKMLWQYFAIAMGLSITISVIAGLYPSSKAAKLDPVESLRHE